MKFIKRTILIILILTATGLLFRGWLYRHLITYKSDGIRTNYTTINNTLIAYIEKNVENPTHPDIQQIIKYALSITSKQLNYTYGKNDTDPNKLIHSQTAHCVGYATFFATTCNYLLDKYNLSDMWTAKPQIGQLYFLGVNIHKYFNSAFFKDHDFVIIENKLTGEVYAVDPTLNDYFYIDSVTYSKQ